MSRRYYITLGARTTVGGVVKTASAKSLINGTPKALEGDLVHCPACGSDGVIQVVQPRLLDRYNGKEFALGDDLCMCKCNPPPRLVANQMFACQRIDAEQHADKAGAAAAAAKLNQAAGSATVSDGIPLVLVDPDTQEVYKHRRYRLELKDKLIEGTTDQHGATRPLTAAERAAVVGWHIDGENAPA